MKKIFLISLLVILVAALYGQSKNTPPYTLSPLKAVSESDHQLLAEHQFKANKKLAKVSSLPVVIDWTNLMPPPVQQLNGDCTSFATTYALAEAKNRESGYSLDNQFSPSYLFNLYQANGFADELDAMTAITEAGCSRLSDFPYTPTNYTLPSIEVWEKGLSERAQDWSWFNVGDTLPPLGYGGNPIPVAGYLGINTAKALLAAGQPLIMSFSMPMNGFYDGMAAENYTYTLSRFSGVSSFSGHALCVVGYDDTLSNADGQGSFLVIDSGGPTWMKNGYWRISYKALANQQYSMAFYTFTPKNSGYKPEFLIELQLQNFGCMYNLFSAGIKSNNGQTYSQRIWRYRSGNTDQSTFTHAIIDLTDLQQSIDLSNCGTFFLKGIWMPSMWKSNPVITSIRIVDTSRRIDTIVNANLVVRDSIWYAEWSFKPTITDVATDPLKPATFSLNQNYPNPFNPTTTINFSLPKRSQVTLKVYNLLGQEVATLVNEELNAGSHQIKFDASKLSSGLYIYQIQAGNFSSSKKMMLLK